ncbi:prepilin-type N-terminal cleavage/methylation domain-containing protein [Geminisphaera colitermitum]|uniref:prepilin-type N-terminal cleavage/methylation domain-containing protein n=1 Tax=Geminisphaera colitermitum TaxID=1148786 RepID=UPI000158CE10|nr:prepilin-type N-terminal cleavage/methylation domain-containing protein [Geminisphaera colitermitum]
MSIQNPTNPEPDRGGAFTLIELLTVIAIIGILAAIIIPTVGRVRMSARQAAALSNLRQIGVAASTWSHDNKGRIVAAFDENGESTADSFRNWTGLLAPYVGFDKPQVGSQYNYFSGANNVPVYASVLQPTRWGYGHNVKYCGNPKPPGKWVALSEIATPARTVLMTSSYRPDDTSGDFKKSWKAYVRAPSEADTTSVVEFPFNGKAVVLWVDGHTSTETEKTLMADDSLWDRE